MRNIKLIMTQAKSILILEGHEQLSDSLVELLSIEGFDIGCSYDGVSGIDMAKKTLPDLIICASQFSDIDCWEVVHALRRNKSTRKIPFICISDNPICDLTQIPRKRVSILTKPFTVEQLLEAISETV